MKRKISRHEIQSLMSKNCIPLDDWSGFWKNSKQKDLVIFFEDNDVPAPKKYIYRVSDEESKQIKNLNSRRSLVNSVAKIDSEFIKLQGRQWRHLRNAINKYSGSISITHSLPDIQTLLDLIDLWDEQRSDVFSWQSIRSGRDRNFFRKYWEAEQHDLWSNFFWLDSKLVGYSVVSRLGDNNCFNYLIGKSDLSHKGLSMFIDFKTFERIHLEIGDCLINWGASGKKLLEYKNKFPVERIEKVWLCIAKQ